MQYTSGNSPAQWSTLPTTAPVPAARPAFPITPTRASAVAPGMLPAGFLLDDPEILAEVYRERREPQRGWMNNAMRGMGDYATNIAAGLLRTTSVLAPTEVENGADARALHNGLSEGLADDPALRAEFDQMVTELLNHRDGQRDAAYIAPAITADALETMDFGYEPRTTWEDVKASPIRNVLPFIAEQGIVSVPDMAAALTNLPLYITANAGRLMEERRRNNGLSSPTWKPQPQSQR